MIKNEKGFTLIEIIAVLVILGVLAAVAIPKYNNIQDEAKKKAAISQVAEIKGTLSSSWGKALLVKNGQFPALSEVLSNANLSASGTLGQDPDAWSYSLTEITNGYTISVTQRSGDTGYQANGNWYMPQ